MRQSLKFFTITVILVCFSLSAQAQIMPKDDNNVYLLIGGFSKHFEERSGNRDYNEVNNNLGLEYERYYKNNYFYGFSASYVKNSVDNDSVLLTLNAKKKWDITRNWNIGVGVGAGIQNGYPSVAKDREKTDFVPVIYPFAEITYKRVGIYGSCVPNLEYYDSGFCFVGGKIRMFDF